MLLLDRFGSYIHTEGEVTSFLTSRFQVAAKAINDISSFSETAFEGRFIDPPRNADASITIPSSLFTDVAADVSNSSRIVYTAYPNDSPLFSASSSDLASAVIAATFPGLSVSDLSENNSIMINFKSPLSPEVS